ncbi:hypothetical protein ACFL4O_02010 [bacterium]
MVKYFNADENKGGIFIILLITALVASVFGVATTFLLRQETISTLTARKSGEALHIAEAGINKAIQQIIKFGGSYTGETDTSLGSGAFTVTVSTMSERVYQIISTGYIPDSSQPLYSRQIKCVFRVGVNIVQDEVFTYACTAKTDITIRNFAKTGSSNPSGAGNVRCNGNINGVNFGIVDGNAYAGGSVNLSGSSAVNGTINEGVESLTFPVLDMSSYKIEAVAGGTIAGDVEYSAGTTNFGPKYIQGNLTVRNEAVLNLTGTVYVDGNILIRDSGKLKGNKILCTEGTIEIVNFSSIGETGSPLGIITNSTSSNAVHFSNAASSAECVIYAPYGAVYAENTVVISGIIAADIITIENSAELYFPGYDINLNFPEKIVETAETGDIISWEEDKV